MAQWCIPFWVTFTLTLTSASFLGFRVWSISPILQLSSNVSYARLIRWGHTSRDCDIFLFFVSLLTLSFLSKLLKGIPSLICLGWIGLVII